MDSPGTSRLNEQPKFSDYIAVAVLFVIVVVGSKAAEVAAVVILRLVELAIGVELMLPSGRLF